MSSFLKIEIDVLQIRGAKIEGGNIIIPAALNEVKFFRRKDGPLMGIMRFYAHCRKEVGKNNETYIIKQSLNASEKTDIAQGGEVNLPIIGNVYDDDINKPF